MLKHVEAITITPSKQAKPGTAEKKTIMHMTFLRFFFLGAGAGRSINSLVFPFYIKIKWRTWQTIPRVVIALTPDDLSLFLQLCSVSYWSCKLVLCFSKQHKQTTTPAMVRVYYWPCISWYVYIYIYILLGLQKGGGLCQLEKHPFFYMVK